MSERLRSIRAVVADYDDTQVGAIAPKTMQHRVTAKMFYDLELTDKDVHVHYGEQLESLVDSLYNRHTPPDSTFDVDEAVELLMSMHRGGGFSRTLLPGTLQALEEIHNSGLIFATLTASPLESIEHDMEMFGITPELAGHLQAAEHAPGLSKPDPAVAIPVATWLLKEHGITPEQTLYAADSLTQDKPVADGIGWLLVGCETGLFTRQDFADADHLSIPNFGALPELLGIR